ncbi:WXG100 family type VII secretion target [Mycolicibacterium fortuitum]
MESHASSEGLRVDTDPVITAAIQFYSIAEDLREGLRQVTTSINDVVEANWRGEAAAAFRREWDDFHDAAKTIVDSADKIADLVSHSMRIYDAEDSSSAALVRSVWQDV